MRRAVTKKTRAARPPKRPADGRAGAARRHIATDAIDWSLALRSINLEHLERLSGAERLPPIMVWEYSPGQFRGIDGFHRWGVARERGDRHVEVIVKHFPPGRLGEKAFDFECVRSNIEHGLPLSREERDRAILRIWQRWGGARVEGETLDHLGQIFNLTKQRIHQIVRSGGAAELPNLGSPNGSTAPGHNGGPGPKRFRASGRFSSFGRFSAATRRLSRLLADTDVLRELLRQRRAEVVEELVQLRRRLDALIEEGRGETLRRTEAGATVPDRNQAPTRFSTRES
jgi:hypothetical protein